MQLTHCIYNSIATRPFDNAQLAELLQKARAANGPLSVTGMLLHVEGTFFQILEGDDDVVRNLFAKIAGDVRHASVTRIIHEPIPRRRFADWTMGFASLAPSELVGLEGANDFFDRQSCLTRVDEGRAKKLLAAFDKGRWRRHAA
jgi:hypothetical protein